MEDIRFRAVIDQLLFFEEAADAKLLAHFGERVEVQFVGRDLGGFVEAAGDGEFKIVFMYSRLGAEV